MAFDVDFVVKTYIIKICIFWIEDTKGLYVTLFNEKICYHIIYKFGPIERYLYYANFIIRVCKISQHQYGMWSNWTTLDWGLGISKKNAVGVCGILEMQFKDNHLMQAFKVLGPTNVPARQVRYHHGGYKSLISFIWSSWSALGIWW